MFRCRRGRELVKAEDGSASVGTSYAPSTCGNACMADRGAETSFRSGDGGGGAGHGLPLLCSGSEAVLGNCLSNTSVLNRPAVSVQSASGKLTGRMAERRTVLVTWLSRLLRLLQARTEFYVAAFAGRASLPTSRLSLHEVARGHFHLLVRLFGAERNIVIQSGIDSDEC